MLYQIIKPIVVINENKNDMLRDQHFDVPVLQISFNRPHLSRVLFETLERVKPKKLYLFVDGPRVGVEQDQKNVPLCRHLVDLVSWECEIFTKFPNDNMGCRDGVKAAIDWFFEHEESGIILEDDCIPATSFFRFCGELLNYYRNNRSVGMISGDNLLPGGREVFTSDASYDFSKYALIWGWATWRDRWKCYEEKCDPSEIAAVISKSFRSKTVGRFWKQHIIDAYDGVLNTWDMIWSYSMLKNELLCVCPKVNMITNIGFGEDATHTTDRRDLFSFPSSNIGRDIGFSLIHQGQVKDNDRLDRALDFDHYKIDKWNPRSNGRFKKFVAHPKLELLIRVFDRVRHLIYPRIKEHPGSWRKRLYELSSSGENDSGVFEFTSNYSFQYQHKKRFDLLVRNILMNRCFEFEEIDPIVVDLNAEEGVSALFFRLRYPLARMFVYEPDMNKYRVLEDNLKSWDSPNIQLLESDPHNTQSFDLLMDLKQKIDFFKCHYSPKLLKSPVLNDSYIQRINRMVVVFRRSDELWDHDHKLIQLLRRNGFRITFSEYFCESTKKRTFFDQSRSDLELLLIAERYFEQTSIEKMSFETT